MTKWIDKKAFGKIFIGTLLMGFAYAQWMKPNEIINGGVTSLAMITNTLSGFPLLVLTNGFTLVLLIISWFFLGSDNFFRSCLSSVFYNVFFSVFYLMPWSLKSNLLVEFLLANLFIAVGYYLCITANSSTVGLDIVALVIHKKWQKLGVAKILRYLNWSVLTLGLISYNWQTIAIGIVFSYVNSWILGIFLKEKSNRLTEIMKLHLSKRKAFIKIEK
ncbi:YitT family protein [Enterococcus sp. JM9B]|uniref:YitT family protein n=1 Tax=Enterococcus sp. JM9B TaxID=1857216 RepID=UPI00137518C7|nr:YitT family protein [Enterococcus sp. JM9B]